MNEKANSFRSIAHSCSAKRAALQMQTVSRNFNNNLNFHLDVSFLHIILT